MTTMIPNDERGWILASVSGLACAFGACFINLDIILHVVPRWRSFNIRESTTFLAASLSLSFGVMFFSALFSLLPEAQRYYLNDGYRPDQAGYAVVGFFLVGVLGLQLVSELLHRCLPSSIVSCEDHGGLREEHAHTHGPPAASVEAGEVVRVMKRHAPPTEDDENSPLLERRPSLLYAAAFLAKANCVNGKCYGYSDHPCDQICSTERKRTPGSSIRNGCSSTDACAQTLPDAHFNQEDLLSDSQHHALSSHHNHSHDNTTRIANSNHVSGLGHHHVAKNKFLSIGVQTSIAIGLHKFPEGFITYATNHANPALGFNVFIALFIHNIAEGFAMSLPLFLALRSRTKAVIWASLLGGLAQPAGALIAWLSIRGAEFSLNYGAYGILFSITAGIMCSVGLQLFSQAIQIHHGSRLSFIFAFLGMSIMGVSSAINAE